MRRRLRQPAVWVLAGAVLLAGGIVALVEAHNHRPPALLGHFVSDGRARDLEKEFGGGHVLGLLNLYSRDTGWPRTTYDIVHIAGVVLLVAGALLTIAGLLALARRTAAPGS
jgi:hypothetical protein